MSGRSRFKPVKEKHTCHRRGIWYLYCPACLMIRKPSPMVIGRKWLKKVRL